MPSKWRMRRIFGPLVKKMARSFGRAGLSPNGATWIMLLSACASAIALNLTYMWVFSVLVFFTGLMDGVDGNIARQFDKKTKLGEFFDSFADRLSEVVICLGILGYYTLHQNVWSNWLPTWFPSIMSWIAYMILGSMLVSYVRARAEIIVKGDYDVGLFGRSERLFTIVIFSAISLLDWGVIVVAVGALATAFYRVYKYRAMLHEVDAGIPQEIQEEETENN